VQTAIGKFVWHDNITTDAEAAKSFYTQLFGWELEVMNVGGNDYPMIKSGGRSHGGFGPAQGGAPPHWLGHVLVEDVDATAERAKSAGGRVVAEPFDIPDIGRMALIGDPQGASLSAFQAAGEPDMPPAEGVFVWDELMTTDVEDAKRFYGEVFGWTSKDMDMGELGTYTLFKRAGDVDVSGLMQTPEGLDAPPNWLVYIATDDVDETVARAEELGGSTIQEAMDFPTVGRLAVLRDPLGAVFGVFKPTG
jgi:predicted enzyme related to lactoylglutathione lyase